MCHLSQIYRAFGLGSSYAKVLKFDFLLKMAECKVAGRELPDVPHSLLGDIWQVRRWNRTPPQAFVRPNGGLYECMCAPNMHHVSLPMSRL